MAANGCRGGCVFEPSGVSDAGDLGCELIIIAIYDLKSWTRNN